MFAARQIVLSCDLIEAPAGGTSLPSGSTWEDVIAVMAGDEALSPIADLLRATIEGQPLDVWRRAANALGIHLATADAIGIGPILDPAADPEALEEIRIMGGPSDVILSNADT